MDGELVDAKRALIRADDSAYSEGRGAFTTVRIAAGRPRFAQRHAVRLQAAARELDLGSLAGERVHAALAELAGAVFGGADGIVRLQISRDASGLRLLGVPRPLGPDREHWRAAVVALPHLGHSTRSGLKVTNRLTLSASRLALPDGVDEVVLVDERGQLVEGARSNLFCALSDGTLATPPIGRGAVAGIARAVCLERLPEIREREIPLDELRRSRELIATNAVRGARPITRLDGEAVGSGAPGAWSDRLSDVLAID